MTREELRAYVEEQRSLNNIPYHVYSALIDGIDTLEQEPVIDKIRAEITALKSHHINDCYDDGFQGCRENVLQIIDKYKIESEDR